MGLAPRAGIVLAIWLAAPALSFGQNANGANAEPSASAGEANVTVTAPPTQKEAFAIIQCKVAETGKLADCVVLSEQPAGKSFGASALKIAKMFKVKLKPEGSAVVGETFKTKMTFKLAP